MADELIAGRYRLVEPLGRGSMSAVWLAEDEELGRRVAVKTLAPSADRARFEREARAAAALSHPNIVSLYDYGEADGKPFMVLECLPGGSLEDRLRDGRPLPDREAQRVATDIAAGLAHAHERDLVHRDLKPANILFDSEGRAKIADFGIARMRGTGTLTEAGTVLGTASYISPEQAAGRPAGPQSDVYSFGVILFRMLTGRLPFVSANAMELVRMHRDDPPPAVSDLRDDAPAVLESLATAALAKDPADRPADGAALLAELRGEDTTATMVAAPAVAAAAGVTQVMRPAAPPARRRRTGLVAAAAAALLLVAGGALALALTGGGGDGSPPASTPALSLPGVATEGSTTAPATTFAPEPTSTTAPTTTTGPTTTAPTTTAPTTTAQPTTTAPVTTVPPPVTTAPVTTVDATTVGTTTDTTPAPDTGATTTTP